MIHPEIRLTSHVSSLHLDLLPCSCAQPPISGLRFDSVTVFSDCLAHLLGISWSSIVFLLQSAKSNLDIVTMYLSFRLGYPNLLTLSSIHTLLAMGKIGRPPKYQTEEERTAGYRQRHKRFYELYVNFLS